MVKWGVNWKEDQQVAYQINKTLKDFTSLKTKLAKDHDVWSEKLFETERVKFDQKLDFATKDLKRWELKNDRELYCKMMESDERIPISFTGVNTKAHSRDIRRNQAANMIQKSTPVTKQPTVQSISTENILSLPPATKNGCF